MSTIRLSLLEFAVVFLLAPKPCRTLAAEIGALAPVATALPARDGELTCHFRQELVVGEPLLAGAAHIRAVVICELPFLASAPEDCSARIA